MPKTKILHISDTHARGRALDRLNELAMSIDVDVVALTGDCTSTRVRKVRRSWDKWPQRLKLSVPGNHDDIPGTYERLRTWTHSTPWLEELDGLMFMGLNVRGGGRKKLLRKHPSQM